MCLESRPWVLPLPEGGGRGGGNGSCQYQGGTTFAIASREPGSQLQTPLGGAETAFRQPKAELQTAFVRAKPQNENCWPRRSPEQVQLRRFGLSVLPEPFGEISDFLQVPLGQGQRAELYQFPVSLWHICAFAYEHRTPPGFERFN